MKNLKETIIKALQFEIGRLEKVIDDCKKKLEKDVLLYTEWGYTDALYQSIYAKKEFNLILKFVDEAINDGEIISCINQWKIDLERILLERRVRENSTSSSSRNCYLLRREMDIKIFKEVKKLLRIINTK